MLTLKGLIDQRMGGPFVGLKGLNALTSRPGDPPQLVVTMSVSGSRSGTGLVTSSAATVEVTNPTAGASYHVRYEQVSGDIMAVDAPASFETTFSADVTESTAKVAVFRARVTDSLGNGVWSGNIAVTLIANPVGPPSLTVDVTPNGPVYISQVADPNFSQAFSVSSDAVTPSYNWYNSAGHSMSGAATANCTITATIAQGSESNFIVGCTVTDTSNGALGGDGESVRFANLNP